MSVPRAVLDADVIFSRVLHELMGRLAVGVRLFDLVWSEELLGEAKSSLMAASTSPRSPGISTSDR